MEKVTTKTSEDEMKFDEVHAYLSKGEYPHALRRAKNLSLDGERMTTNWLMVRKEFVQVLHCGANHW